MDKSKDKIIEYETIQEKFPAMGLNTSEYREAAHKMIDVIIDYHESLKEKQRLPIPDVEPGFIEKVVGKNMPETQEKWQEVFKDIEKTVFNGSMHWQAPGNFGYYPASTSYPSQLGDMLCEAMGTVGFTWAASPACAELEMVVMDWLARALNLPRCFIHDEEGPGGGGIQSGASQATMMTLLSARSKCIEKELSHDPQQSVHEIVGRMVAYSSKCSHSSVAKTAKAVMVQMRLLDFDENISLRGETLRKAIEEDRSKGNIPVYVCATLGTTDCCSFDDVEEIGKICQEENIWLHVDAAFAGNFLICPEYQYLGKGLKLATSFCFNPCKGLMISWDSSCLWVRNCREFENSLKIVPEVARHQFENKTIDFMHWQIPMGRRFRALKIWFVLRMLGLEGLRHQIRSAVNRAKYFEKLVRSDERFELVFPVTLGLVCFRLIDHKMSLKEINEMNKELSNLLKKERKFLCTPSTVKDKFFLRVVTASPACTEEVLKEAWGSIQEKAKILFRNQIEVYKN